MVENSEKGSDRNVKITDRRHFDSDGAPREPDMVSPAAEKPAGPREEEFLHRPSEPEPAEELPVVDFATLVMSFRTTALMSLGLIGDPAAGKGEVNLDGARQMIEILSLLQKKTSGNLDAEEARLLEQVLYELRLDYVNRTSGRPAGSPG